MTHGGPYFHKDLVKVGTVNKHTDIPIPFYLKSLAWLQIGVQVLFPLVCTLAPASAGAATQKPIASQVATELYILQPGESAASVARKYNMSLASLRAMNQSRAFAQGFDSVHTGDTVAVPLAPLSADKWNTQDSLSSEKEAQVQKWASLASRTGAFLSTNPDGDAASSMARGMATGEASGRLQQWLSQFGTARVQLNADKNFSLENSELDLLIPWYEKENKLLFTQTSLHETDDRLQSNIGAGLRWFNEGYMLGGNTFLDYDWSRAHARLGVGAEYWRDFLKLSANSYLRLTGWKNSKDIEDYEERPANGWDLRAEGWIPTLPQLGGKLTYEQYYGQEVALFGKDNRQSDPYALTAGLSYTPVPLVTFNVDQRQGKAGEKATQFGVQLNYQFGMPWQQQISPDAVGSMRSLAGSRYDLVDRNNNIVLEYRKKEVIRLQTADLLAGYAGEQKSLNVSVNAKNGLDRIEWAAPSLLAAGGQILKESEGSYSVILPGWQPGEQGVNTYTVGGIAFDKKGNASERAETQVTVTQAAISVNSSSLTPTEAVLTANGTAQQVFVLKVNDKDGSPVDIAADEIVVKTQAQQARSSHKAGIKPQGNVGHSLTAFTRRAAGEYVATLTAGTMAEMFTMTPVARNMNLAAANVAISADSTTAHVGELSVVHDKAKADGKDQNQLSVVVIDGEGNKVPSQIVNLAASDGAIIAKSVTTDSKGEAAVPLTHIRSGEVTVTAGFEGSESKTAKVVFVADEGSAQVTSGNLAITPEISSANGKAEKTVSVLVTDAKNNPVPNVTVALSASNNAKLKDASLKTNAQGEATTSLTSLTAGVAQVTVQVNKHSVTKDTMFTGNSDKASVVQVTPANPPYTADGTSVVTFSALINDDNGNPLPNIAVDWKSDRDSKDVKFGALQTVTDDQGIAKTDVTSTRAYAVSITAFTNASSKTADLITFVADSTKGLVARLVSDKPAIVADGTDSATITAKIADSLGNPLPNISVALSANGGATLTPVGPNTDQNGVMKATLVTKKAGSILITAGLANGQKETLSVEATADTSSWKITSVKPDTNSFVAGDAKGVTYSATVTDGFGNKLSDVVVSWQLKGASESFEPTSRTNAEGVAVTTVKSNTAGTLMMEAWLDMGNHLQAGAVEVKAAAIDLTKSSFGADKTTIGADGKEKSILTVALKDSYDNAIVGKTITLGGGSALSGFNLSKVVDNKDGTYTSEATSTSKGKVTLSASSEGKQIGSPIDVVVGAVTLDLRFDNAQQQAVYTRNYTKSQSVRGIPDGLTQHWSSSAPDIASVDSEKGTVTLLKSGEANITVTTPGSEQYNPAMASYNLVVDKAQPGMSAESGSLVTAEWADGKNYTVKAKFSNADAATTLTPKYVSDNTSVVTVDGEGALKAIKPGETTVTFTTPETEQFYGETVEVSYVLKKASLNIVFSRSEIKMTDEQSFTLQQPGRTIPSDAQTVWESSDSSVVSLSKSGAVQGNVSKGQSRLTLNIAANEYYNASVGHYDVMIYSKPSISMGTISYTSKGSTSSSGSWKPLYTTDGFSVTWSADTSNKFTAPESVVITLKNSDGSTLLSSTEYSPSGSMTTQFAPLRNFWGKSIRVELLAKGYGGLEASASSGSLITVSTPTIDDIKPFISGTTSVYTTYQNGAATTYCRGAVTSNAVDWRGKGRIDINLNGKTLIAPIKATLSGVIPQFGGGAQTFAELSESGDASNQRDPLSYDALQQDCWMDHERTFNSKVSITFDGRSEDTTVFSVGISGNSQSAANKGQNWHL